MMKHVYMASICAALAAGAWGCADGRAVPAPTEMVEITDGLTFTFGVPADTFCVPPDTPASQVPTCDQGNTVTRDVIWPPLELALEPFAIDVHEVTNLQYEYCVAQGGCTQPVGFNAVSQDQQDYYLIPQFHDFPVVGVRHEQAVAYCAFVGKRLPTEYEWERVAKGPNGDRTYPVEGDFDDDVSNCTVVDDVALQYCAQDTRMIPVMATDSDFVEEGGQRIYQLMGNAAEWTATRYDQDIQCEADPPCARLDQCAEGDAACRTAAVTCGDCPPGECFYSCEQATTEPRSIICEPYDSSVQPLSSADLSPTGNARVVRGGHVRVQKAEICNARAAYRDFAPDASRAEQFIGFRCARDL